MGASRCRTGPGVVEAVGDGVTGLAAGDRVVSLFFPTWAAGPPQLGDFATTPGDGVDGYARETVVRAGAAGSRVPRAATATPRRPR